MCAQKLDKEAFDRRLKALYSFWKDCDKDNPLNEVDSIIILNGKEEVVYSKTTSLQMWLFGYELQDTAFIFCQNEVHFLTSKKKCEFLKPIESSEGLPSVTLHLRNAADKDKANIDTLMNALVNSGKGKTVGHFAKDKHSSDFVMAVKSALKTKSFEMVDLSRSFGEIFSVKDDAEISNMKKASDVTCGLFAHVRKQIIDIIDQDKKVKHAKLSAMCEDALKKKEVNQGISEDFLEMCYPVIVQSGGEFSLKFSAESNKNNLHFGVILTALGVRYKNYCSNVIRCFMVNPTEEQTKNYDILGELMDFAGKEMKEGVSFSEFCTKIVDKVESDRPDLKDKLVHNFGFVTGIEFRDSSLLVGPKTQAVFKRGMTLNFNIGFQDLENSGAKEKAGRKYALWLGDTFVVGEGENGECGVLTTAAKRRTKAITFVMQDEESSAGEEEEKVDTTELIGRGHRRGVIMDQKTRSEHTEEEKRSAHQRELYEKLMTESKQRLSGLKPDTGTGKKAKSNVAYKGAGQMPKEPDIGKYRIVVDKKYETVILPINGQATPFHISTIKNISSSVEGDYTYLRVNCFHPGGFIQSKDSLNFQSPEATFLKEMTYRASNEKRPGQPTPSTNLNTAFRLIKEVQKKFKTREAEEKEKEDLVEQDTLIMKKGVAKLTDLFIRPNIISKRITGSLEASVNGFRFTSIRGDKVDILYNNIKHAFYQPCDGEMIILLHFHLKHAIMFGKKKHYDVQFYTEVGEITTDLGKAHHMHDRDDLESEERERMLRKKLKGVFKTFCEKVETLTKNELDFDVPFRNLGFVGAPFRSNVLLQPTSGCVVQLTEWPPFVVCLDEVEFVYFERVLLSIRNFDMVFVFKDYSRKVVVINSIPATSLDHVKNWLNSCDIYFMEGTKSLNWPKIMKTIVDDPEDFFQEGGWSFIAPHDSDEEDEDDDEEEDEYCPESAGSESGSEESSEEEGEEEDWSAEEDSDDESDELGSDESEGKDWDQLEKEAKAADERREVEEVTDRRPKSMKRRRASPEPKRKSKKARRSSPSPKKHKKRH